MRPTKNPLEPPTPPASATQAASPAALAADHHLWRNGRLWWIAITLYDAHDRRRRVRESLGTSDVGEARRQRDQFLDRVRRERRWTIASPALRGVTAGERGRAREGVAA